MKQKEQIEKDKWIQKGEILKNKKKKKKKKKKKGNALCKLD